MAGVPRQKAMTYVAQAVLGATSLVLESGQHPQCAEGCRFAPREVPPLWASQKPEERRPAQRLHPGRGRVCGEEQSSWVNKKKGLPANREALFGVKRKEQNMTEVVAALIWEGDRFLIGQRPEHKKPGAFVGVCRRERPDWGKARSRLTSGSAGKSWMWRFRWDVFLEVTHEYGRSHGASHLVSRFHCSGNSSKAGASGPSVDHPGRKSKIMPSVRPIR